MSSKRMTKEQMAEVAGWGYRAATREGAEMILGRFPHWPGVEHVYQDKERRKSTLSSIGVILKNGQEFTIKVSIPRQKRKDKHNG